VSARREPGPLEAPAARHVLGFDAGLEQLHESELGPGEQCRDHDAPNSPAAKRLVDGERDRPGRHLDRLRDDRPVRTRPVVDSGAVKRAAVDVPDRATVELGEVAVSGGLHRAAEPLADGAFAVIDIAAGQSGPPR
jgi:hypothetical protein